jgi:DNA-binding NarL/FixJ family response regulator
MRELVQATLSDHPDIEVVGEIQDEPEILPAIDQTHADCLIIAQEESGNRPSICDFVLEKYPHMKILAVAPGGDDSMFYWVSMEIRSSRVETSEEGVLNALRGKSSEP